MPLPKIQDILFDHLVAERAAEERAPSLLANKLHANASSAGGCARAISFRVLGVEATPVTGDALFNFAVGDAIHDKIQTAVLAKIPAAEKEVSGVIEDFITCRADLKYPSEDSKSVCCEIKSISDFGFEKATGSKLKSNGRWGSNSAKSKQNKPIADPEGPKPEHLLQVGISAKSIDADYLCIVYARKTAAKDESILAEWRFKVSDFEEEIQTEISRLKHIVMLATDGKIAGRDYQGTTIVDPSKVKFPCGYCGFIDRCQKLGAGVIQIEKREPSIKP